MQLSKKHLRIGLIADTHIADQNEDVPEAVYQHFSEVDLILHAGDIYIPQMLDRLERMSPLVAVAGNGDEDRHIKDPRLADSRVLELGGLRVGLRHSIVFPEMGRTYTIESEMQRCFGGPVNIIVVGDTHVADISFCKSVLVVNPGSPTRPNHLPQPGTIGMLEITDGHARVSIIHVAPGLKYLKANDSAYSLLVHEG